MERVGASPVRGRALVDFLWLPVGDAADAGLAAVGSGDLIIIVLKERLRAGCYAALMSMRADASRGGDVDNKCIGFQPADGRSFLMFLAPAGEGSIVEVVFLRDGEPPVRSEPHTFRHPTPADRLRPGAAFDLDARALTMTPAVRGKVPPAGHVRLHSYLLQGPGTKADMPVVAPSSLRESAQTTFLELDVLPPALVGSGQRMSTMQSAAFYGQKEPTALRLDLTWSGSAGIRRPARLAHACRQDLRDEPRPLRWLDEISRSRQGNACSFEIKPVGSGDILVVLPTEPSVLEVRYHPEPETGSIGHRYESQTAPIDDRYTVFQFDDDCRPLPCNRFSFEPSNHERRNKKIRPEIQNKLQREIDRVIGEHEKEAWITDVISHLGATHPEAVGRGHLREVAEFAKEQHVFFFLAERVADLFGRAKSDAARERLGTLLDPAHPKYVARLVSPAVMAFADRPVELARLEPPPNANKEFSDSEDALEPYFNAIARTWEPEVAAAREPQDWFEKASPEARIAVVRLMTGAATADSARRLVHAGLLPSLEDQSPQGFETELSFAERYLMQPSKRLSPAILDALRWANGDAHDHGAAAAAAVTARLHESQVRDVPAAAAAAARLDATRGVPGEIAPHPYIELAALRNWRSTTNVDALLAEMGELRSRLMREYEAGRTSVRHVPRFSRDGARGGRIAEDLRRAAAKTGSPGLIELVEASRDWQAASRAALLATLQVVAAAANWKLPHEPSLRLDPSVRESVDARAMSLACELNEIVETYEGAVRFIYAEPTTAAAGDAFELALRKRAKANAAAIARSLRQLASTIGHTVAGSPEAIEANARAVAALDLKARLDRFVDRTAARFKRGLDALHATLQSPRADVRPGARQEATATAIYYIEEILPGLELLRLKNLIVQRALPANHISKAGAFWRKLETLRRAAQS